MGRILSIDYGRKRTGIAVTDPLKIIATGINTIATHQVVEWLVDYMSKEDVETIVVGYPLGTDGLPSETAKIYVDPFIRQLKNKFPNILIDTLDERYTSKIAFQSMIDAGLKKKDRADKSRIDTISATLILQDYLSRAF